MSSVSPKSPHWTKPSDIMKFRQLKSKKRNLERRLGYETSKDPGSNSSKCILTNTINSTDSRKNPFGNDSNKRQRCNNNNRKRMPSPVGISDTSCDSTLFQLLHCSGQLSETTADKTPEESAIDKSIAVENLKHTGDSVTPADSQPWKSYFPFDWSLKTSIRVTSKHSFPWNAGRLTTSEEASGVTGFVRCFPVSKEDHSFALDTSINAQLFQCCQIWVHPSLPWLRLFPRHHSRTDSSLSNDIKLQSQISKMLHCDWAESFRSLFHLLRARQCPYFYVCAQTFTVLFRAAGIAANPKVHALMTPTTRGLRQALTDEGVCFTLALLNEQVISSDSNKIGITSAEDDQGDLAAWLKVAGVEDKMLAQIDHDPNSADKQKEIDNRAESLIYVEDSDVHAFYNFLLNSKSSIATYGPMAGIPPTLLAPVAFTGSTLRSLKMRQQQARYDSEQMHVFDVTGPILPHTVHYIDNLLQSRMQDCHYEIMLSTLEPTTPFSAYNTSKSDETLLAFGQQSLSDCGLSNKIIQGMCLQKQGVLLRRFKVSQNLYQLCSPGPS